MNIKNLVLSCICLMAGNIYSAAIKESEKIIMAITSAHTRVFSKENLITERISEEDSKVWENLLSEIYKYVNKNGRNLAKDLNKIRVASDQLIDTLRLTYGLYILPNITDSSKREEGLNIKSTNASEKINKSAIKISSIMGKIEDLKEQENIMKRVQDKIIAYKVSSPDVVAVLERLALTVEVTISKVFKDAEKLKQFVQNKSFIKPILPTN